MMSKTGIQDFAECLSTMQEIRLRLLSGDNQDVELGQLLDRAKDSVKYRFAKIPCESEDDDA